MPKPAPLEAPMTQVTCTVNGEAFTRDVPVDMPLLEFIRDVLGLTGTKGACLEGECGSCTVLVDGATINSCLMLAAQANESSITTIEGLASGTELDVIQDSFVATGAAQCGYCTPGLIMSARALLNDQPDITEAELLTALEGNICRCTGYASIIEAVKRAHRESQSA
ncbi:MAG: (2Fe-2S)-binding protein [Phycisphaerae bacterium]|nr:MAG: (2Fe-2S)-binding protein [Phycisphaerae bacterium]